jgi:hypothetical protein
MHVGGSGKQYAFVMIRQVVLVVCNLNDAIIVHRSVRTGYPIRSARHEH